jgi:hypothetical protein
LIAQKNWSKQKYQLLDTVEQLTKKVKTGQKSKIICRACISSSFTFRQKILTAQIATGRKRFWKMSTARHNL